MVQLKGYLIAVKGNGNAPKTNNTVVIRKRKGFLSWLFS